MLGIEFIRLVLNRKESYRKEALVTPRGLKDYLKYYRLRVGWGSKLKIIPGEWRYSITSPIEYIFNGDKLVWFSWKSVRIRCDKYRVQISRVPKKYVMTEHETLNHISNDARTITGKGSYLYNFYRLNEFFEIVNGF